MNKQKASTYTLYQAGGMEKAKNNGATWRANLTPKLEKLGFKVFNPCIKECDVFSKYNILPSDLKNIKKSRNVDLYQKLFKDIVAHDLEMIKRSDFIVVYYDESVNLSSGTVSEMTFAHYLKKPVYVVLDVSYDKIPSWTLGCVDRFFKSFKDLLAFLKKNKHKIIKE